MSCASLEPQDKDLTSRGKYSFSSEMQFLSGNIFIYNSLNLPFGALRESGRKSPPYYKSLKSIPNNILDV